MIHSVEHFCPLKTIICAPHSWVKHAFGYRIGNTSILSLCYSSSSTYSTPDLQIFKEKNDIRKYQSISESFITLQDSKYYDFVEALFTHPNSQINTYWKLFLVNLFNSSTRNLVYQLTPFCPMGYDPLVMSRFTSPKTSSKTTLLSYIRDEKLKHSDCILLIRVGDFYESYGIDALLLMEHCGLNPMGGKARAGCPTRNIQRTVNQITSKGYKVAVYEEIYGSTKNRLKQRTLAQIVSSANPTYLYDIKLHEDNGTALSDSVQGKPYVGVIPMSSGCTMVEVSMEKRSVTVLEKLTEESVNCRLKMLEPMDPIIYVPPMGDVENVFPWWLKGFKGLISPKKVKKLSRGLLMDENNKFKGQSHPEWAKRCIVKALLEFTDVYVDSPNFNYKTEIDETNYSRVPSQLLTHKDFVLISTSSSTSSTYTHPLCLETATQLGLISGRYPMNKYNHIPSLVHYVLPDIAPISAREFVCRWLLAPPCHDVAMAMSQLLKGLNNVQSLPPLTVLPIGKILALIRAQKAPTYVFQNVVRCLDSIIYLIESEEVSHTLNINMINFKSLNIVESLMVLLEHETGLAAKPDSLKQRCLDCREIINRVIPLQGTIDGISCYDDIIPCAFFKKNEEPWKYWIKYDAVEEVYGRVKAAAFTLAHAVAIDFWGCTTNNDGKSWKNPRESTKSPVIMDIHNNLLAIRAIPSWTHCNATIPYFRCKDRYHKLMQNRFTTSRVECALSKYVETCEEAKLHVTNILMNLCDNLCNAAHLPTITQVTHANLILSVAISHVENSNKIGWNMAHVVDDEHRDRNLNWAAKFIGLWPYWMHRDDATPNTFVLDGLFLLTAPNMSGKSTLMRSMASTALLANCGFYCPVDEGTIIRRFDHLFLRGASSDVPIENKSAFGAEMNDIEALFRTCGRKSLVFVDELGRGTSPKDGAGLAGAILETMAEMNMCGVFATHLHDVLNLPLCNAAKTSIRRKRMSISKKEKNNSVQRFPWTYKLEDGVCTESLALVTAAQFGIPKAVLKRAVEFMKFLKKQQEVNDIIAFPQRTEMMIDIPVTSCCNDVTKEQINTRSHSLSLGYARELLEDVCNTNAIHILPRWTPPPSLERSSCVYLLCLGNKRSFYVGETDSLAQRLRSHRSKGKLYANMDTLVVVVNDKTEARKMECRLIRKMTLKGFDMISTNDGRGGKHFVNN